jgi:CubicO group peptidase (beta-lactamase class C family)
MLSAAQLSGKFKKILLLFLFIFILSPAFAARHFPPGVRDVTIPAQSGVRKEILAYIAPIIEKGIDAGYYPGAVIYAVHHGHVMYRGVFGNRRILPDVAPMKFTTIFDMASLTKVIVTTPAIMQLVEESKIDLDAPVAKYWPAFANNGKGNVTVRELLTHTSGLPPEIPEPTQSFFSSSWHGQHAALNEVIKLRLRYTAGTTYIYSDVNFIVLAYLVEIVSGERIDQYARHHIFKPLGMDNSYFVPPVSLRDRIAPTAIINKQLRWGQVEDPIAYAMDNVSGTAGLFSDAGDLGIYAQCLLNNGRLPNKKGYLLGPLSILKMTTPQTPANITEVHGLGWDIDTVYSSRGVLFPVNSYGHTGWTGTSIWIDPLTKTYLIILTSRTHPTPAYNNQIIHDRRQIANIVAASLTDVTIKYQRNTGVGEMSRAFSPR